MALWRNLGHTTGPPVTAYGASMRSLGLALGVPLSLTVALTFLPAVHADPGSPTARGPLASSVAAAVPELQVTREVTGLRLPWDVQVVGPGRLLVTERETRRLLLRTGGSLVDVEFPSEQVWASGETGLMSLAVDPGYGSSGRFYTCHGGFVAGGGHDVRVVAWRLDEETATATRLRTLLRGLPASTGRHGGCRLLLGRGSALLVGTGDAGVGRTPQNLRSLGGKVLRLNRFTGAPAPSNPWPRAANRKRRYVLTYGHRNVQGLARRRDGSLWSVEHGPSRDDEVNRLVPGGNYGWNPVPGYNESRPMTDQSLPGRQVPARWRSGSPTLAVSGAAWVRGPGWGALNGTLAVAALKAERLVFMKFGPRGRLLWTRSPAETRAFGRLRSVTRSGDGSLLVTTSNGSDDAVLRVRPLP